MKRNNIEHLLPQVMRRAAGEGTPLSALLEVMAAHLEPTERTLADVPGVFAAHSCPPAFLPLLATWLDLDWLWQVEGRSSIAKVADAWEHARGLSCGPGRLRSLLEAAAWLSRWRGTARGLRHFLTLATGVRNIHIDEQVPGPDGRPLPYHIRIRAPGAELHRTLIERIVNAEKPAHVTYEIGFEEVEA